MYYRSYKIARECIRMYTDMDIADGLACLTQKYS